MATNHNEYCKSMNCDHYIEWDYDCGEGNVPCTSCKLQGQSHDILEIADNCPLNEERDHNADSE